MDKRKQIGIVYVFNDSWLGGVYYIHNILKSLCLMEDADIPIIDFYCNNESIFEKVKNETNYPYLCFHEYKESKIKKWVWIFLKKMSSRLAHIVHLYRFNPKDSFVYPYFYGTNVCPIYWCPDFQEKYLPEFFSKNDVRSRANLMKYVGANNVPIVFSSDTCKNDFNKFYPLYGNKSFVLKFAVIHPDFSDIDIKSVLTKYKINSQYFLCANQFWKHKNHLFLFKAFRRAVDSGLNAQLICTGNFSDFRNTEYIKDVESFLAENNQDKRIRLLGMIDRKELLCLMKNSFSVIQPSLFEGWNTTVEDCKAMNKFIFLSDLPVHREQINSNVCFFDPNDENDLVEKLLKVTPTSEYYDYNKDIRGFGRKFVEMMNSVESLCQK